MNKILTIGLAAAAVVVIGLFVGTQLFGSAPGGFGSETTDSSERIATPEPTATPEPPASAPTSPAALTESFTSTLHGYSVSYPEGWTAQAATEPWSDPTLSRAFGEPRIDFLYDPTLEDHLFLAIASQPIGDSRPEDWVAGLMASDEGCGTATEAITVDAASGLIGTDDCSVAVVTSGGRGYWIQLYASGDDPLAVAPYDMAWLEEVLATVQLHPEDAVD